MKKVPAKKVYFVPKAPQKISEVLHQNFRQDSPKQKLLFSLGAIYKNRKRVLSDEIVSPSDELQIYLEPKRYLTDPIDWNSCIVEEKKEFICINKPTGIPVHSTEDNLIENVVEQLRTHLKREIWLTHRLDTSVSGLMVLAKTEKFQREFNSLLGSRNVRKFYRALVERPPKTGLVRHYMSPEEKVPKKLSLETQKDWIECRLDIHEVKPWKSDEGKDFWEVYLELQTGRTHQIRAQLSWIGSPILGDKMYRGRNRAGFTRSHLALHSSRIEWSDSHGKHQFEVEPAFRII